GRIEVFRGSPEVILDTACNADAMTALARTLRHLWPAGEFVALLGFLADKDPGSFRSLARLCRCVVVTEPPHPTRSGSARGTASRLGWVRGRPRVIADPDRAMVSAMKLARREGLPLVVAGSLFLAARARRFLDRA
ncbi:MAG: hypothetical protein IIA44_00110, partial [Acidobacteria bacterium]|nr:hypothetical protein [Acidobacteriota bacterium]